MNIDYSLLELYSESDLKEEILRIKKLIKFQAEQCEKLEQSLEFVIKERREYEKFMRIKAYNENIIQFQSKAKHIEGIISKYMQKHWYDISFLFVAVCRVYDESLIHTDCKAKHAYLPRQIMIYFIAQKSGLTLSEIAKYFNMQSHATVIHAIKQIELICNDEPEIEKHIDKIRKLV